MIACMVEVATGSIANRRASTAPQSAVLVVRPSELIANNLNSYEEAMSGKLIVRTYAEPNIMTLVRSLPSGSQIARSRPTLLITQGPKGESVVDTDDKHIKSTLSTMAGGVLAARFPALPVALLAGVLIGSLLWPANLTMLVASSVALAASLYKATHACPVCPVDRLLGIPMEMWGTGTYFIVSSALIFQSRSRTVTFLAGFCAVLAAGIQLFLFAHNRDLCVPCTTIAAANGALLAVSIARLGLSQLAGSNLYLKLAVPVVVLMALTGVQALTAQNIAIAGAADQVSIPIPLRGHSVSTIQMKPQPGRRVVVIVSDICHSCTSAKQWLAAHPTVPVMIVRLLMAGEKRTSPSDLPPSSPIRAVPDFLFLANGTIVSEIRGWSDDATWELSMEQQISNFIGSNDRS